MTLMFLLCLSAAWGEDSIRIPTDSVLTDSIPYPGDSIQYLADSISSSADSIPAEEPKKSELKAPVYYQSSDSMVMTKNGTAYLHGKGELKYETMELTSEYIRMNIDSSLVYA